MLFTGSNCPRLHEGGNVEIFAVLRQHPYRCRLDRTALRTATDFPIRVRREQEAVTIHGAAFRALREEGRKREGTDRLADPAGSVAARRTWHTPSEEWRHVQAGGWGMLADASVLTFGKRSFSCGMSRKTYAVGILCEVFSIIMLT